MAEAPSRPNSTIYVGGLDTSLVTAATLSEAFIPFGEIVDITLPKPEAPSSTDLHRGFGYVEFEDAADAKEAIDNMDQSELYGRVIKVAMAKPDRKETGEVGLGSTTAIWEQVCLNCCLSAPNIREGGSGTNICIGRLSGQICSSGQRGQGSRGAFKEREARRSDAGT